MSCWEVWSNPNHWAQIGPKDQNYKDITFESCLKKDSYVQSVLDRWNFTSLDTKIRN